MNEPKSFMHPKSRNHKLRSTWQLLAGLTTPCRDQHANDMMQEEDPPQANATSTHEDESRHEQIIIVRQRDEELSRPQQQNQNAKATSQL